MNEVNSHPFDRLTPDLLIDAVESQGFICDGRFLALNSYENRVYQIGIEAQTPMIAKFYRPERWSDDQILEEHQFCFQLQEQELPVVCPWINAEGVSISHYQGFRFALYERKGGHAPELDNLDNLFILGRLLGRFHGVGASQPFIHRPMLNASNFGWESYELISQKFMPRELCLAYNSLAIDVLNTVDQILGDYGSINNIRVHGDCHSGNILWRDDYPHFVDFDDARMAPAIQDLWMLLSGDRHEQTNQMAELIEGYNEFYSFDYRELRLIEVFRTLRIMHHSAWIARRWSDPAFPRAFSWFDSPRYWSDHILSLREQLAALNEPPIEVRL
jgi:Ser/Thr protein kinase RdoA (MazF antagonist)